MGARKSEIPVGINDARDANDIRAQKLPSLYEYVNSIKVSLKNTISNVSVLKHDKNAYVPIVSSPSGNLTTPVSEDLLKALSSICFILLWNLTLFIPLQ